MEMTVEFMDDTDGKEVDEEEEGPQGRTLRRTCNNRGREGF